MPGSWTEFFFSEAFMPHGHCYLWEPTMVWLQVISNGLIGISYFAISATLAFLVRRGADIPFKLMFFAFGVFIVTCGVTHLLDVYVIWHPAYWVDGSVRAVTAFASVATAVTLPPFVPKALAIARGARAAHDRGMQLETMVRDLETLYERSKELDQMRTNFFANVSHELRTPLTLILGPVEKLALADNLSEEQRRDLDIVNANARTLLKHVNDLLEIAKFDAGKLKPRYVQVDLSEVVKNISAHFDSLARERGIEFRIDVPEGCIAEVDRDMTERALVNLLSNAFKFTPKEGKVRVALRLDTEGLACLSVSDSGPGISVTERQAVFDRFRQLDDGASRKFGGTGLGLSIVSELVRAQLGDVWVDDAPEGGAAFAMKLPLKAPEGVTVSTARESVPQATLDVVVAPAPESVRMLPRGPEDERPLVLVVEDTPDMNRFVAEALAEDYRVDTASNGLDALEWAKKMPPDLVVSDLMMPKMSGEEMLFRMRKTEALADVPVLLLTAREDEQLRVKLLSHGAQDYVTKPFAARELRARVKNLVTTKRVRDLLQRELRTQIKDLETLAKDISYTRRELHSALESMRVAKEHAERASQTKSTFLGMVSHELRTPLTALELQMTRLARAQLEPDEKQVLGRMGVSVARLTDLIESLLQYSRIESGKLVTDKTDVDLRALVHDTVDALSPQAAQRGLDLRVVDADGDMALQSDPRLVRLILSNLIVNAIKFTDTGFIEVALRREDGTRGFWVRDTGRGIAPEHHARIFQPFEQLTPVQHKHVPGVGLGLALVREMAHALGGSVRVESTLGRGSSFEITLPV